MAGSESASLNEILSQLESYTSVETELKNAYTKFSRHFTEDEVSLFSLDVAKNIDRVLKLIKRDVGASSNDVNQGALQVLGVCLHDQDIVRNVSPVEGINVVKKLCTCVHKTDDKTTCSRALWCLGKQNFSTDIIEEQVNTVLDCVDYALEKWGGNSITVEHECINTVARLCEQAPNKMKPESARWGKHVLLQLAHNAIKVRERALTVIENTLEMLLANQKELTTSVVPSFKSKICPELKRLLASKHESFVLKCWGILVQIFGEELHHGSFINSMLPIIELGFKGLAPETKMAAFSSWQSLIDNFATNSNILSDTKRIKLLMQVFKMNNARVEEVAKVKLNVWWHLIWLLGNKITSNFDMVGAPLLQFCVGGSKPGDKGITTTPRVIQNGISPVTPRMNLSCSNSQWPVFKSLQLQGCEVLAHFLGSSPDGLELPYHHFTLDCLRCEVITGPAMFIKNSLLFISTAIDLFISLGKDIPESLLFHIWYSLIAHMKNAIDSSAKVDMRETITAFLTQLQVLVLSRVLSNTVILKMFEGICCLPKKVLCSSAYNIGGGEMIHGTPAIFLMELLLTPALLQSCQELESYHSLYSSIINSGLLNSTGSLGFLELVLHILDQNADFLENPEMLWRFWSAVVQPLLDHISKSNEINQGDSLEHNFSCVYQALLFPLKHKLSATLPQPTNKTLTKTWTELYKTVNRLAAMVTNAEANIICEEVCHKILEKNKEQDKVEPSLLEFEVTICHVMVTCLDYSSLGNQSTFGLSASPAKWTRKRNKSLGNIHSLVLLLSYLQERTTRLVANNEANSKMLADKVPLQGMLNTMVDSFSSLFTHVSSSTVISAMIGYLAQPISELYHDAAKKTSVKVYNNPFQQKIEKLWMDITTCLQSRYQALFDSEFLLKLSPLLEATFLHSRRQIKNQTLALWNVTFGKAASLEYPEALKPVLSKVKEKSVISVPGWVTLVTPVIEETPISQMSQSQAPEPHIPGMPSPHKIHGSFLNKTVSPNVKKSPLKPLSSPKSDSAKKKILGFDSLHENDFVVIKSSPRKPRVLTDHQKEVMKERRILPAMYNSLEISQDTSMMAHFNTDTQDGSQSQTPTPTIEQPFSLFGSAIPSSIAADKQDDIDESQTAKDMKDIGKKEKKKSFKLPEPAGSSSSVARRRSVRFKDEEKKQINKAAESTDDGKRSNEKTVNGSLENTAEEALKAKICDIKCDDIKEVKQSGDETNSETETGNDHVAKHSEIADKDNTDFRSSGKAHSQDSKISEKDSLSGQSIPQNVLGVIGLTPESSSKSGESKNENLISDNNELSDQGEESQPLLSWTQRLNQLNKSPRSESPLKNILSQDLRSSPQKARSQSPIKSPRRHKGKKQGTESYGNLDKWIIRSPAKKSSEVPDENVENISNVCSVTIVEDTQSPSKFSKDKLGGDIKTNSVMETPPKYNFSYSNSIGFGSSNRKLFQSSQDNIENDHGIVEDSNIIPGSPNSNSFSTSIRPGTPVLRISRLTEGEIKKYSPLKEGKDKLNMTPTKLVTSQSKHKVNTAEIAGDLGGNMTVEKNSQPLHKHDDFSAFKPLETEIIKNSEIENFFSKSLTDTEQAMLKFNGDEKLDEPNVEKMDISPSDSEVIEGSQSLSGSNESPEITGLFSQLVKEARLENEQAHIENNFHPSADIFSQDYDMIDSGDLLKPQVSEESQTTYEGNQNLSEDESETTRSRKRKQKTPKKTTPENVKKNKRESPEIGSTKKASKRLQEKRELKEIERQNESQTDMKKADKKNKSVGRKKYEESRLNSQEENKEEKEISDKFCQMHGSLDSENHKALLDEETDERTDNVTNSVRVSKEKKQISERGKIPRKCSTEDQSNDDLELEKGKKTEKDEEIKISNAETLEKTPESRKPSAKSERKSTTKKKKAVAQKRVLKRESKDVVVNETDSNLDLDLSDDDLPLSKKVIAENLEKKIDKQLCVEENIGTKIDVKEQGNVKTTGSNDCESDEGKILAENKMKTNSSSESTETILEAMDVSVASDDDIPLSNIKTSQEKLVSSAEKNGKKNLFNEKIRTNMKKDKMGANKKNCKRVASNINNEKQNNTSPISNKLRSGAMVKTRLRSGQKKIPSPNSKKKLAIKRVHNVKKKLNIGTKRKNEDTDKLTKSGNDVNTVDADPKTSEKTEAEIVTIENLIDKIDTFQSNDTESLIALTDHEEKNLEGITTATIERTDVFQKLVNPVLDMLDETPTKGNGSPNKDTSSSLLVRNSDSKLILGSRKFEKRSGFARRSILKPSSLGSVGDVSSPKRDFHPIKIARIYSPTASPSASILKKRRLSDDATADTNSPPAKQRRVSFAEPLIETGLQLEADLPQPVLVAPETTGNEKHSNIAEKADIPTPIPTYTPDTQLSQATPTQATPTQNTYQSTQESQLNDTDPIYPELLDCELSVEKIVPQLTSSIWSRGLVQLIRARNIVTIGDLSALTELQIDGLPIKAPKVQTVKKVLRKFSDNLQAKKSKLWSSPKVRLQSSKSDGESFPTVICNKRTESVDDNKTDVITVEDEDNKLNNEKTQQLVSMDIEKILASSGDLVDEVHRLSQKINQSQDAKELQDAQTNQSGTVQKSPDLPSGQSKLMEIESNSTEEVGTASISNPLLSCLSDLSSKFKSEQIQTLRTDELFQAHQFISDLQNHVVTSLRTRCHSPTS